MTTLTKRIKQITRQAIAVLTLSCFLVAQTVPPVVKDGISIANDARKLTPASSSTLRHFADDIKTWAKQSKENGVLASGEAALLKNADPFEKAAPDATAAFNALKKHGFEGTKDEIQDAVNQTTKERRTALVEKIKKDGLYSHMLSVADKLTKLADNMDRGIQPDDGYCDITSEGEDLMAMGALIALWAPEAGLAMAAVGAAIYFYGKYGNVGPCS
jgi:hypothetical protein